MKRLFIIEGPLELQPAPGAGIQRSSGLCLFSEKSMAAEAMAYYQKAIELPAPVHTGTSRTWPGCWRRGRSSGRFAMENRAIALAGQAQPVFQEKNPLILRTLAAAYAEKGQFSDALAAAKESLALAISQSDPRLASTLQKEIELYQANSPCRYGNN